MGTSLSWWGSEFCAEFGYRVGLVGSGRPGLRTYDAKSDFAALDSESTRSLGSTGYLSDLSDFGVLSYGSVSDFGLKRSKIEQSLVDLTGDPLRESETEQ